MNGGQVSNVNGNLGYYADASGSATVTGTDSLWANSGGLTVGGPNFGDPGGSVTLNISNGGAVTVGGALFINHRGVLNLGSVVIGGANILGDTLILNASHKLNVSGNATIAASALVGLAGSDFSVGGDLGNDGLLSIDAGDLTKVKGALTNTGNIIDRGTLQSGTLTNSGTIQLAGNAKILATTLNLNGGVISGTASAAASSSRPATTPATARRRWISAAATPFSTRRRC